MLSLSGTIVLSDDHFGWIDCDSTLAVSSRPYVESTFRYKLDLVNITEIHLGDHFHLYYIDVSSCNCQPGSTVRSKI